ncbi:MAG: glycine cleavage system protein H [Bdellovibrionales bacterium RIFOXYD1_FULL_53_11]|nr:MAG: glycine cleavage system protein H [Bdellovibrionales bacterium RIFOXYD1_FULL_53_11]
MRFPADYKYSKDHEWAHAQGNTVTVGVTDHAQRALGDIVFVELPPVGRVLKQGETFGVVESIKAVSDLFSPVTGKVIEVNTGLPDDPAQINKSPHTGAWLIKMELADPSTLDGLMSAGDYSKYVESLG